MWIWLLIVLALAVPCGSPAAAQGTPVGAWIEDYARMLQLTGQIPVTPVTVRPAVGGDLASLAATTDAHAWRAVFRDRTPRARGGTRLQIEALPFEMQAFANTSRPWGWNDGAVWQGKGSTLAARAGAEIRWGPATLTLAPVFTRSSNHDFSLSPILGRAGYSPYAYPFGAGATLDAPQRFGNEPVESLDWGNTSFRVELGPVTVGLSHESLWWGPGIRNDVLLTNNAPGFWHAFLSPVKPISVGIGTVTGRWIWGSLKESAFFDTVSSNDRRYMTGAAVSFVPRWAKGLELGAARLFLETWPDRLGGDEIFYLIRPVFKLSQSSASNPTGEDFQDQMATVYARWVLPAAGLELYGEWAKGDHSADLRDLMVEPEHASGYLAGLTKVLSHTPERTWRFASELTILGAPRTTLVRSEGAGFFYVHSLVLQGYTNRGQVLGAGIGPGSSQLSVSIDRFAPWGRAGVTLFRTVYDNDRFYRLRPTLEDDYRSNEVEPSITADAMVFRGPWDFSASVTVSNLLNQWYVYRNDDLNVNLSLSARYHPSRAR